MDMKTWKGQVAAIGQGLMESVRQFPLEALLGVVYFAVFVFDRTIVDKLPGADPVNLMFWFFPQYVLLFTLHRFSKGRPVVKVLFVLSWFLWIPLLVWCTGRLEWSVGVSFLLAGILLVAGGRGMDDAPYGRHILWTLGKVAAGFLVGGLLMLIVTAVIASVNFLFALHLSDPWFSWPNAFIALVILPLLCCRFVTEEPEDTGAAASRLLSIAVDAILSPALVIYALILYVYAAIILIHWQLPEGGVAYLVLGFLLVGLLCHLLRLQVEKRHFEWFYRAFPAISAVPLVLLWAGIVRRVGDYGFTEPRVYLLALAALVTVFVAMLLRKRSRNFQLMTLMLAGAAVLLTFIPGIRARDFGLRSQQARLERLLPVVLEEGKTLEAIDCEEIKADSVRLAAFHEAFGVWEHLRRKMDEEAFQARYGAVGDFVAMNCSLIGLSVEPEDPAWVVLPGRVDLERYRHFVPAAFYRYYEDGEVAIFFADESKRDTLLVCPVRERLAQWAEVAEPQESDAWYVLVYKNARYMAVFGRISPSDGKVYHFRTGEHYLYAKDGAR